MPLPADPSLAWVVRLGNMILRCKVLFSCAAAQSQNRSIEIFFHLTYNQTEVNYPSYPVNVFYFNNPHRASLSISHGSVPGRRWRTKLVPQFQ